MSSATKKRETMLHAGTIATASTAWRFPRLSSSTSVTSTSVTEVSTLTPPRGNAGAVHEAFACRVTWEDGDDLRLNRRCPQMVYSLANAKKNYPA